MAELNRSHEVSAAWPASAAEATDVAREAMANGATIVVAMGGDGIVHHVSQAMVGTEVPLGIVPTGTTNVVARLLGIPTRAGKAAALIADEPRVASLGTARIDLDRGDVRTTHHAIFACGMGMDAEVVRLADADPYRKYRFGSVHYARTALSVGLRDFPSTRPHVTVTTDGREARATTALVQFREVYTYFGRIGLRLAEAAPDPMTVLVMGRLRRRRIPKIAFGALTHRDLGKVAGIDVWNSVERLEMEADPPAAFQADGEGLGLADGARVTWSPGSLRVITGAPDLPVSPASSD